ncbi:hypothetical protein IFU30_13455 [Plantibacter sp. CFBP 8798]|nr:hypothetical protein [Plantibacter sp. CFBP 8798]MBD8467271.1 hypothetical protein [Plantibacter sp. CFBP 8798]
MTVTVAGSRASTAVQVTPFTAPDPTREDAGATSDLTRVLPPSELSQTVSGTTMFGEPVPSERAFFTVAFGSEVAADWTIERIGFIVTDKCGASPGLEPAVPPAPVPQESPSQEPPAVAGERLAETGVDPGMAGALGAVMLVLGVVALRRPRRGPAVR